MVKKRIKLADKAPFGGGWRQGWREAGGFSLLELLIVLAVVGVITAVALPATTSALKSYHLSAAVKAISGGIQGARYQAISHGYHYNVTFTAGSLNYQVASKIPPATTFSNVGSLIPWSSTPDVSLTPTTTIEFYPGGTVAATTGSLVFTVTNGTTTETITVSSVGSVSVSP